jgi:RNA polymerase sigma factor (sigma-70 family)
MQMDAKQLWEEYYPSVYGYFFRRVNNREDVEDLTSIVMTAFLDNLLNTEKSIQNPHGLLWKIAHNQLALFIRNKNKNPMAIGLEDTDFEIDREIEDQRSFHYRDRVEILMECANKQLKDIELFIVEQIIMLDKKATQISDQIQLSSQNTRQKLSRSLKKLRQNCLQIWQESN